MRNGTLSNHLYGTSFAYDPLTWMQRLEICKGAGTRLSYLHIKVRHIVIHRDVKTSNILLDDNINTKVLDFGLSKENPKDKMLIIEIKGTRGYMDPKYARGHKLIEKSDVYAFRVVLCARKAVIDPYLIGKIAPECFKVFVEIAESCIAEVGTDRPSMNDVMERYLDIVFPVARDVDFDDESKVDSELDSNVCRAGLLDSDTTGLSNPTIDPSTSVNTFSSTTNIKSIGN
ncbi:hypothetical protein Gotur_000389 [Gossypium turneri]